MKRISLIAVTLVVVGAVLLTTFCICLARGNCSDDTLFVGRKGVYSAAEVEAGRFAGFSDKVMPFPLSLFEKRGEIISDRRLSDFGLNAEWLDLQKLLAKLGETEHHEGYSVPLAESWSGGEETEECYAYFYPSLPAEVPWRKMLISPWDFEYEGASLLVIGQEGRVTYVSFRRHLAHWIDYLNPPEMDFIFGGMNLGGSYSDLRSLLGSPSSSDDPLSLTKNGKTFLAELPDWYFICGTSPNRTVMLVNVGRRNDAINHVHISLAYEVAARLRSPSFALRQAQGYGGQASVVREEEGGAWSSCQSSVLSHQIVGAVHELPVLHHRRARHAVPLQNENPDKRKIG